QSADLGAGDLSVAEDHQGRDAPYAILRRGHGILVDIELGNFDLVAKSLGNLLQRWRDHLAGTTPLGPEVDDHRPVGFQHVAFKASVGHLRSTHSFPLPNWSGAGAGRSWIEDGR